MIARGDKSLPDDEEPLPAANPGGQGGGVLEDDHRLASDINLVRRAVRNRWDVPEDVRQRLIRRLASIADKTEVAVVTKKGEVVQVEGPADANAIGAARVLVMMNGQDQADDHHAEGERHTHLHGHIAIDANRRRASLAALAERLGVGGMVDAIASSGEGGSYCPTPAGEAGNPGDVRRNGKPGAVEDVPAPGLPKPGANGSGNGKH